LLDVLYVIRKDMGYIIYFPQPVPGEKLP